MVDYKNKEITENKQPFEQKRIMQRVRTEGIMKTVRTVNHNKIKGIAE